MFRIYHPGLLLCNVPHGQDGISMDSYGQRCCCSAMYGQELCNGFKGARVASITQNLQEQDDFLRLLFSNSTCKEILDGLPMEGEKQFSVLSVFCAEHI